MALELNGYRICWHWKKLKSPPIRGEQIDESEKELIHTLNGHLQVSISLFAEVEQKKINTASYWWRIFMSIETRWTQREALDRNERPCTCRVRHTVYRAATLHLDQVHLVHSVHTVLDRWLGWSKAFWVLRAMQSGRILTGKRKRERERAGLPQTWTWKGYPRVWIPRCLPMRSEGEKIPKNENLNRERENSCGQESRKQQCRC